MIIALNLDLALLLLRLGLAAVFLAHGPAKLTKSKQMAAGLGLQPNVVWLIGAAEVLGALSMIFGIRTDIGAVLLSIVMIGAIYFKTQKWGKKFTGDGGFEFETILLIAALTILLSGPGVYSF